MAQIELNAEALGQLKRTSRREKINTIIVKDFIV